MPDPRYEFELYGLEVSRYRLDASCDMQSVSTLVLFIELIDGTFSNSKCLFSQISSLFSS